MKDFKVFTNCTEFYSPFSSLNRRPMGHITYLSNNFSLFCFPISNKIQNKDASYCKLISHIHYFHYKIVYILYTGKQFHLKNSFQWINIILISICHLHMPKNDSCRKLVPNYLWISLMNTFLFKRLLTLTL